MMLLLITRGLHPDIPGAWRPQWEDDGTSVVGTQVASRGGDLGAKWNPFPHQRACAHDRGIGREYLTYCHSAAQLSETQCR